MGTSTPFGGGSGRNPLIPSWLDADGSPTEPPTAQSPASDGGGADGTPPSDPPSSSPLSDQAVPDDDLAVPPANRFQSARTQFNKYLRSGGSDRAKLGKALVSYVSRAAGGAKTAARRMSSDRAAASRLGALLSQAGQVGIRETLRTLNLDSLANRSISEIYAALVDVVCAPGGDLDEAFPRDAYLDAIAEVLEVNPDDLEKPSSETIALIMERFIANTVRTRILNAIANGLVVLPKSVAMVKSIDEAFREFVRGAASDAMTEIGRIFDSAQMTATIDGLYERCLSILQLHAAELAREGA